MADTINVTMEIGGLWDAMLPPAYSQVFAGEVNLTRTLTHYAAYVVESDLGITASASKAAGAAAEIILEADGSHTPTFSEDFTAWPDNDEWDVTAGTKHVVCFYNYGDYIFYNIKKLK
jgi:hypothetical protein